MTEATTTLTRAGMQHQIKCCVTCAVVINLGVDLDEKAIQCE